MQFISQLDTVIFVLNFTRGNVDWELIPGIQYQNFLILISSEFPLDSRKMTNFENFFALAAPGNFVGHFPRVLENFSRWLLFFTLR